MLHMHTVELYCDCKNECLDVFNTKTRIQHESLSCRYMLYKGPSVKCQLSVLLPLLSACTCTKPQSFNDELVQERADTLVYETSACKDQPACAINILLVCHNPDGNS